MEGSRFIRDLGVNVQCLEFTAYGSTSKVEALKMRLLGSPHKRDASFLPGRKARAQSAPAFSKWKLASRERIEILEMRRTGSKSMCDPQIRHNECRITNISKEPYVHSSKRYTKTYLL